MTVEKLKEKIDKNFTTELNTTIVEINNEKILMIKWSVNPYNSYLNKIRELKSELESRYVQVDPNHKSFDMVTPDNLPIQYYKTK